MNCQGFLASLQVRNKLLAFTSPYPKLRYPGDRKLPDAIESVQTSIAFLDLRPEPLWEIRLDGRPAGTLPVRAKLGQRFTIRDGGTFIAIVPLPGATDLGRDEEVVLSSEGEPTEMQGGGKVRTTMVLNIYNYLRPGIPLDRDRADLDAAWGGFALEIADATEFADFAAFEAHTASSPVQVRTNPDGKVVHAVWRSGADLLEAGFAPGYDGDWDRQTPTDRCFVYRRWNGAWPYLPEGVERETTLAIMGRTGRLEKGGARLTVDPGRMASLEHEPVSGTFVAATPLPDTTGWKLELPGGIEIEPEGKVGMLRVTACPRERRVSVEHALRPGDSPAGMVRSLLIRGLDRPAVSVNGRRADVGADGRVALDAE